MKKIIPLAVLIFSLACAIIIPTPDNRPTPDDFPEPPMTVIVEFPNVTVAPTVELRLQPITQEKMPDAQTFFLILKTRVASGDSYGIAESVKYPITVNINGAVTIASADEFVANYNKIFTGRILDALTTLSEEDLILLPEGVRVGQGEVWFNLFCVDAACSDTQFLITQIDN